MKENQAFICRNQKGKMFARKVEFEEVTVQAYSFGGVRWTVIRLLEKSVEV
jgi:hypothetical protein